MRPDSTDRHSAPEPTPGISPGISRLLRRGRRALSNPRFVLLLGVSILAIAILVAGEFVVRDEQASAVRNAERHAQILGRALGDQLAADIAVADNLLQLIAAETQKGGMGIAALRLAHAAATEADKWSRFFLFDESGQRLEGNGPIVIAPEVVTTHRAAHARGENQLHISPARAQPDGSGWALHLSRQVMDREGRPAGMVVAALDMAPYQRAYGGMQLGRSGVLQLLHQNFTVLARFSEGGITAGQRWGGNDRARVLPQVRDGCRTGRMISLADGEERISSFCAVAGYPLSASVSTGWNDALADAQTTVLRYRVASLLLLLLLGGGTWVMLTLMQRQWAVRRALRDSEARFSALTLLGSDWYWESDAEYRLTRVSTGLDRMAGRGENEYLGKVRWELPFVTPADGDWAAHKLAIARGQLFRNLVLRYVTPEGIASYGSISGEPVFDAQGKLAGYRGTGNNVTAEVRLRQRLQMQHEVARVLAREQDVGQALHAVIEIICRAMDWAWGAHRCLDPETLELSCHESWLAPGMRAGSFVAATQEPRPRREQTGIISVAIQRGQLLWVHDINQLSLRRSQSARAAGLHAAMVMPILQSRGTAHALEFFSTRDEQPDDAFRASFETLARDLGQYLDRHAAESAAAQLEKERRHLLDMQQLQLDRMPIPSLLQDRNFLIIYANPAAERIFGYSATELQGKDTVVFLIPETERARVWERRSQLRAGERTVSGTNGGITRDGRQILCEWSSTSLFDEAGVFSGVLVVALDVTERMRMISALKDSEARYRQIFESTPLPMWVADLPMPKILAVNDAATQMYGYTREEFLAMTTLDLQPAEDRERVKTEILERDPTKTMCFQRRHLTRDGRTLFTEATAQPFQFNGRPARLVVVNDVSERQRMQRALMDSEARFRAIFEQASVPIGVRDLSPAPRWLRVNHRLCAMLGYSEAELLGLTSLDITPEEDLEEVGRYNVQLQSGALRSYNRQRRYRHKDGRIIWVDLSVAVVTDTEGVPQYLVCAMNDITDALQSRRLLTESEARYRQIFALSPLPMFLRCEETFKFMDVNDAFIEKYGYTRTEILTQTADILQAPADRAEYLATASSRNAMVIEHVRRRHMRRSGEIFPVEVFSYPLQMDGRMTRLALIRDMTDQFQAERLLRESEQRVALALSGSGGALFDWNVATGEVYLSERWNEMLGGPLQETHATFGAMEALVHPEDAPGQKTAIAQLLKSGGTPHQAEFRVRNHAGDWIWIECRGSVVEHDAERRASRVLGTNVDITPRKQIEVALQQRERELRASAAEIRKLNAELEARVEQRTHALSVLNQELESFSYSVSHDLRAPLRTIDGFSQILLQEHATVLNDAGKGYLERVRAGSQRMSQLIDDLLELSRLSRRSVQVVRCDLTALATEIAAELRTAEPGRQVQVEIAPGMTVHADQALLRIALDNLLRNAWKFTSRKPEARIEIGQEETGEGLRYFVRDNGAGFDMAYAGKLFGAFQRLHTVAEFPGTGIGLALVQRVFRRHGGQVWADAKPDCGATFFFVLPQLQQAADSASASMAET